MTQDQGNDKTKNKEYHIREERRSQYISIPRQGNTKQQQIRQGNGKTIQHERKQDK